MPRTSRDPRRPVTINTALTVPPTRIVLNEQEHLVAPVVMVVEGVLNGGLIPGEELHPQDWNAVAITIGHPQDASGLPHSARQPQVLASCGVGHLFHVRRGTGQRRGHPVASLQGELWLNLADVGRCGPDAQQAVDALEGQAGLECSTAFFSDAERQAGSFYGDVYTEIHRNLRPDHLALLPNEIGACSWADGCGAPRLNHATLTYTSVSHPCACSGASCTCDEGDVPMSDPVTGWRRFVQVLRDFVAQEAPPDSPDEDEEVGVPVLVPPEEDETEEAEEQEPPLPFHVPQSASGTTDLHDKETAPMPTTNTKRWVDALITHAQTSWVEDDRADLEALTPAVLIRMVQDTERMPKPAPQREGYLSVNDALDNVEPEEREAVTAAIQTYKRQKDKLIEVLTTNTQNPFTREQLQAMTADDLTKLVRMAGELVPGETPERGGANYSGRRLPQVRLVTDEEEIPAPPKTMELVVARQKELGLRA